MDLFTTREMGELLGVAEWRVRRLFEDGTLPEPPKFGGKRVIKRELIPTIVDALRLRGPAEGSRGGWDVNVALKTIEPVIVADEAEVLSDEALATLAALLVELDDVDERPP